MASVPTEDAGNSGNRAVTVEPHPTELSRVVGDQDLTGPVIEGSDVRIELPSPAIDVDEAAESSNQNKPSQGKSDTEDERCVAITSSHGRRSLTDQFNPAMRKTDLRLSLLCSCLTPPF